MAKMLSILLQKSDPSYPWGFTIQGGGQQDDTPLVIHQVTPGSLAAQYLAPGDTILQIEKMDTRLLHISQVEALIIQPGKCLDLLVLKGDSPNTFPRTPTSPSPRSTYNSDSSPGHYPTYSSDSGSASGGSTGCGRDLRRRKQHYWERISKEDRDFSKEGFTKLESGANSPFKHRPVFGNWRRCLSEEKTCPKYEDISLSYDLDSSSYSNRIQSVWSPNPDRSRTPTSDFWPRDEKLNLTNDRQGDITFWEYDSSKTQISEPKSSFNRSYRRHHSDFSHGYSSLSSEYAATPKSEFDSGRESPLDSHHFFMKKPSDFWGDHYRDEQNRIRLRGVTSPTSSMDSVWKNSNVVSKTEFKKSTSVKQTSYSSKEGAKSFETVEHVNKTKETEKSSKIVEGGKEEVIEKTKKNKEYILANKDDVNGQPIETKKVINDFKSIEKVMDGENEFCNKIKEHNEEVVNSNTPVNFYDNVQQHVDAISPIVQAAEWCDHKTKSHKQVSQVKSDDTLNIPDDNVDCSPFQANDQSQMRWTSSTPLSDGHFDEGFIYEQEEPLMESYFEVDIRSPIEMEVVFPSGVEEIRRQSSQISGGGSPIPVSPQGDNQAPPPPPPPPPSAGYPAPPPPPPPGLPGNIPAVRLNTEIPEKRRSAYEPPAAIQNAMMTKDKKPFTYTPGGLDLSEIRSPRMARRINRNANTPDMAPLPQQSRPTSVPSGPLPPSAMAAMQPQIAIPVLPQGGAVPHLHHVAGPPPPPPPPQAMHSPPSPPQPVSPQKVINRQPSPPPMAVPKMQPQHRHTKSEPQTSTAGSIYVPPIEAQQPRAQLGSLYIPPIAPQETIKPQSPVSQLNKAPTPWMSRQNQQTPKEVPPWVNRETVTSPPPNQNQQPRVIPVQSPPPSQHPQQPQTRIIPIQIEGKEPAKSNERIIPIQLEGTPSPQPSQAPYYNQPPSYQQQQYQPPQYQQQQQQQYQQQPQQQYQQQQQQQYQQQQYQQPNSGRQTPGTPRWVNQQPVYQHNKFNSGSQSPVTVEQNNGSSQPRPSWCHSQTNGSQSPAPVQSQSFKVLQKITGTDGADQNDAPYNSQGVPLSQLRKLQLSDDDRALMDKVKSQVDDETYLHNESDPRYRGSAIPSRAFRILQNMTDGTGGEEMPQAYSPVQGGQNRLANRTPQPQASDAPPQYVPPSEQQAAEPRKYTGGAIPSRSFRMLQAMTAGNDPSDRPGESEF
ncbi:uncharacterized protein LOC129005277 isoform X2 [Macrosteles quadrilineatus]|uniref:uncharacterized protein LOC129005277 isoform X2 n=1 Tax=Macrosteles quadrilineatus TaxID=74068 RepID=UPI0023E14372|nr:uncharacterized protein LOC129005277 isoform X2 [Macrosteles quadrilineatus]